MDLSPVVNNVMTVMLLPMMVVLLHVRLRIVRRIVIVQVGHYPKKAMEIARLFVGIT